jgi:hypothetical protein
MYDEAKRAAAIHQLFSKPCQVVAPAWVSRFTSAKVPYANIRPGSRLVTDVSCGSLGRQAYSNRFSALANPPWFAI